MNIPLKKTNKCFFQEQEFYKEPFKKINLKLIRKQIS